MLLKSVCVGTNPEKPKQTKTSHFFPGGLLDEHDQVLRMTAKTTMMVNKTRC